MPASLPDACVGQLLFPACPRQIKELGRAEPVGRNGARALILQEQLAGAAFWYYLNEKNMAQQTTINIKAGCRIIFPAVPLRAMYEHCRRKLAENYLAGESRERKAFGLVAGNQNGPDLTVAQCLPLLKNSRQAEPYKGFMDQVMERYAVPSETPLAKRGWVADPAELLQMTKETRRANLLLLGTYHMHRVAWPDDPLRDSPTILDTVLGADSRMLMFIISMVKSDEPRIRAFYEGKPDREIPVVIMDFAK